MFSFGSGVLQGFRTDLPSTTPGTPVNFGLVQEVTLDLGFDTKLLYGQNQYPVAIARGKAKLTGKAKVAKISGIAFGNLFFGITPAAGQIATIFAEGPSLIPTTPFQVTAANGANFVDDLGVINAATGLPLAKVGTAATPTAGQYKVSAAGVYTFSSADNVSGISVLINYTYTLAGSGEKIVVTNPLLGFTPTFQANLYTTYQGNALSVKLPNCVSSKLAMATKLDDFMIPEIDFDIFADAAGNVATWSFGEAG